MLRLRAKRWAKALKPKGKGAATVVAHETWSRPAEALQETEDSGGTSQTGTSSLPTKINFAYLTTYILVVGGGGMDSATVV